jgi:hypothetical protein
LNDERAGQARLLTPLSESRTPSIGWVMEVRMGDVVNLKRFKKRIEREQSAKQADANRARFGRTKSERILDEKRTKHGNHLLDQHRIEGEDAS